MTNQITKHPAPTEIPVLTELIFAPGDLKGESLWHIQMYTTIQYPGVYMSLVTFSG